MTQTKSADREADLLRRCVRAYIDAGTLELSLDEVSSRVGISKRMLIHYFGSRGLLEAASVRALEDVLRQQFSPESLPQGITPSKLVGLLWKRSTAPEARGVLLLVMEVNRRAWSGTQDAKRFYAEQQTLWVQLLSHTIPDRFAVETLLQLFQGAVLRYLITDDAEAGGRALGAFIKDWEKHRSSRR